MRLGSSFTTNIKIFELEIWLKFENFKNLLNNGSTFIVTLLGIAKIVRPYEFLKGRYLLVWKKIKLKLDYTVCQTMP